MGGCRFLLELRPLEEPEGVSGGEGGRVDDSDRERNESRSDREFILEGGEEVGAGRPSVG